MNDNAKLYVQHLSYNKNVGPYQCLSLPWWIRANYPVYQPRYRNKLEPLICGEKVFKSIADDLERARHSVDIITWGFDPGMELVRGAAVGGGIRYGDLLLKIATRKDHPVIVRLLVWHDDALSQEQMKNIPGYYGRRFASVGCAEGGFYNEEHERYNAEWFDRIRTGAVPNICFHVRAVPSDLLVHSLSGETPPVSCQAGVAALYATHHQKMLLIDYEEPAHAVGYVMGHNSISDFWDTEQHLFRDPRRERFYRKEHARRFDQMSTFSYTEIYVDLKELAQREIALRRKAEKDFDHEYGYTTKPYQDVSIRMRGDIVFDLNHNFCQAWSESEAPSSYFMDWCWLVLKINANPLPVPSNEKIIKTVRNWLHKDVDPDFAKRRAEIPSQAFTLKDSHHNVQLLRTQPLHKEKMIKEAYANLTRLTTHYIFIQNQYIQYEPWTEHLLDCARRLRSAGYIKPIYVFILTSTPEKAGMDLPTYDVVRKIGQSGTMEVEHAEAEGKARKNKGTKPITEEELAKQGIFVVMGSLWTCAMAPRKPDDYEEIYIHSKVAIVDDAAFTLGSANLNLRSMALDSELNVLSQALETTLELRRQLFMQCSGHPGPERFGDMHWTLMKWRTQMEVNDDHRENLEPLNGQLMKFHVNRRPGSPVL